MLELLQEPWAFRALIASSMVGVTCGVLGCFIVLRNMSLIGDALSHAILPGIVFAFMFVGYSALGFFVGSVMAGLLSAVLITWIQQNVATKNDAAIGIVFTTMFSIGVMGISWISRNEGVHLDLKDFLFGSVLGVSDQDLYLTFGVTVYVLISIVVLYRYLFVSTFQEVVAKTMGISVTVIHYFLMLLLSFAVVAALQTVGVILVVAMLITPASTALLLSERLRIVLVIAGLVGLLSAILGLIAAIQLETTPGPAMAVVAALLYLLAVVFAPKKGIVAKFRQRLRLKRRIQFEDILKRAIRLEQQHTLTFDKLLEKLDFSPTILRRHIKTLQLKGYFESASFSLTEKGKEEGRRLVRAHRLWETYLVNEVGLNAEQIHHDAEHLEHFLSEELLDEVDKHLGFPNMDPHGSPIPSKAGLPELALSKLQITQHARIAQHQINDIASKLWQMGVIANTDFELKAISDKALTIQQGQQEIIIPKELARKIRIEV